MRFIRVFDSILDRTLRWGQWLVLPVVVLLFLQWPLRDLVRAWSREANDLGQCFFALYVATAFTAATRARIHLSADMVARTYSLRTRDLIGRAGAALGLLPWAVLVLVTAKSIVVPSIASFALFPDSGNPGYFSIKLAVILLAVLRHVVHDVMAITARCLRCWWPPLL